MLTRYGSALRQPIGRIHWAGSESATEWCGYMNGAIQSGIRAVSELEPLGHGLMLVTEDFGAVDLRHWRAGGFELRRFLQVAHALALALAGLHARDIIHKDIKPDNVVVHPTTGQLKIIDLGIAARVRRDQRASPRPREVGVVASTGQLEGSLAYVSPEQTGRIGRSVDPRSDLYAVGVTLYELATGQLPFTASDPLELIHHHIARRPRPAIELAPQLPAVVSEIIERREALGQR